MLDLRLCEDVSAHGPDGVARQRREVEVLKVLEGLGRERLQIVLPQEQRVEPQSVLEE